MTEANRKENIAAEWARAEGSMRSAEVLLGAGEFNDSVSRAYYAVFHAARSLLLTLGLEPTTHRGVNVLLNQHFVSRGLLDRALARVLARMQKYREEADYNRFFGFDNEGASEEVEDARKFLAVARDMLVRGGWLG